MLSLVIAHVLAASPVNFTDIFAGTWNIALSQLNDLGAEESNASYRIVFKATDEPGKLAGDLQGEDDDGADRVIVTVTIAPDEDESSFSISTADPDSPDNTNKVTSFVLKSGLDGRVTAVGSAEVFGNYSINILSPAIIELLVVNPETKALAVYRLIKDVPPRSQSMMGMLLHVAPMLFFIISQRFSAGEIGRAHV
jgi:hypothetical protein